MEAAVGEIKEFYVEVVDYDTGKVVERMGPMQSERRAEKVERGVAINLNVDRFYVRIVVSPNEKDG
jgi:hypothetical protein